MKSAMWKSPLSSQGQESLTKSGVLPVYAAKVGGCALPILTAEQIQEWLTANVNKLARAIDNYTPQQIQALFNDSRIASRFKDQEIDQTVKRAFNSIVLAKPENPAAILNSAACAADSKIFPPGSKVYTLLDNLDRANMQRTISLGSSR